MRFDSLLTAFARLLIGCRLGNKQALPMQSQPLAMLVSRKWGHRSDFGLTWNQVIEGTQMVGDDVKIELHIEADKK
jgi:hypothetical protein